MSSGHDDKPSAYMGLDLLQAHHQVACAREVADQLEIDEVAPRGTTPCVILPFFEDEKPIAGNACSTHRRGVGLDWPPEAQFPYAHDERRGVGRVLLATAWARLLGNGEHTSTPEQRDEAFEWRPTEARTSQRGGVKAAVAISATAGAHVMTNSNVAHCATVVPDHMTEAGLEALSVEIRKELASTRSSKGRPACKNHLLWRSAALGISWCRKFKGELSAPVGSVEDGDTLGHIITLSMGLDAFEVSVCPVEVVIHQESVWLVPVVDRQVAPDQHVLGPWGISLLASLSLQDGPEDMTPSQVWNRLAASKLGPETLDVIVSRDTFRAAGNGGLTDELERLRRSSRVLEEALPLFRGRGQSPQLQQQLSVRIQGLQSRLPQAAKQTLGIVIDGSLTGLRTGETRRLIDNFLNELSLTTEVRNRVLVGSGQLASEGAASFAWCAATNRPTYLEQLQPLDFFVRDINADGDPIPAWIGLVPAKKVMAGKPKSFPTRRGLSIEAGAPELRLILRNAGAATTTYRSVPVVLRKPSPVEDPVELHIRVSPGQGYAVVVAKGQATGLDHQLDWARMEETTEPTIDEPAWVSAVWALRGRTDEWERSVGNLRSVLAGLRRGDSGEQIEQKLGRYIDPKGSSDSRLNRFVRPEDQVREPWVLYHPIGLAGRAPVQSEQHLLDEFNELAVARYRTTRSAKLKKALVRASAWTFGCMPGALQDAVRADLRRAYREPEQARSMRDCLTAAGHVFKEPDDMKLVFKAAAKILAAHEEGVWHWIRALRNLARFRQRALAPEVVSQSDLNTIGRAVLRLLQGELKARNYENLFKDCIVIFMFFLKRRRYTEEWPPPPIAEPLERSLETILERAGDQGRRKGRHSGISSSQREWAEVTLIYLKKQNTADDLSKFIRLASDL